VRRLYLLTENQLRRYFVFSFILGGLIMFISRIIVDLVIK
jgi:hypothetical protein